MLPFDEQCEKEGHWRQFYCITCAHEACWLLARGFFPMGLSNSPFSLRCNFSSECDNWQCSIAHCYYSISLCLQTNWCHLFSSTITFPILRKLLYLVLSCGLWPWPTEEKLSIFIVSVEIGFQYYANKLHRIISIGRYFKKVEEKHRDYWKLLPILKFPTSLQNFQRLSHFSPRKWANFVSWRKNIEYKYRVQKYYLDTFE